MIGIQTACQSFLSFITEHSQKDDSMKYIRD